MLRLFYYPPGARGGTEFLFKEALRLNQGENFPDYSSILYLAPSHAKIKETRRIFHTLSNALSSVGLEGKGTYVPPLMLSPAQLAKKLCQAHGERLIFPSYLKIPVLARLSAGLGLAASIGHAALLSNFISEIKGRFPAKSAQELKDEIIAPAVYETGIPDEVALRLKKGLELMVLYDSFLAENGFMDEADSFAFASEMIASGLSKLSYKVLILDGFYEITEGEKLLLMEVLEKTASSFALVPHEEKYGILTGEYISFLKSFNPLEEVFSVSPSPALNYYAYPSREEEVQAVARKIKAGAIGGGASSELSGAVFVFPSGSDYADMAERVFTKYGIPYSFPSGRIGVRRRRAQDLMSILDATLDAPALARVLSSPLFKEIPAPLRAFAPKVTIEGMNGLDDLFLFEDAPKEELKWLKRKLAPLRKTAQSFSPFIRNFLDVLRGLGFESRNFDEELEERLKGLSLLDLLSARLEEKIKPGEDMKEILRSVISSVPDEEEGAGVRIAAFNEAARLEPESLYFAGLKDGDIPVRPEMDLFLPERLRTKLGMDTMKIALTREEFLFKRLVSGSRSAHLSFPDMEGEKVFIPSIFISEGQRLKDPVYGIFSWEEDLLRKGKDKDPYGESITEINVKGRKRKKLRVTDIDAYRACPRRFYLEKELGLSPLEARKFELEPKLTGTLAHKIMERMLPIRENSFEELKERAIPILDSILSSEPMEPFWRDLFKESFLKMLPEIFELEKKLKDEGYSFEKAETPLEFPLKGILLSGKIDRIDRNAEGAHEIIDYKTGRLDLTGKEIIEKGANLQLFLYAEMSRSAGLKPSRVGIYSLKDLKTKFIPGKADIKAGRTLADYIESALSWLEIALAGLEKGEFPASPISDQRCRSCHEKPYCPNIHLSRGKGDAHGK